MNSVFGFVNDRFQVLNVQRLFVGKLDVERLEVLLEGSGEEG
jgi:hypothetical protein